MVLVMLVLATGIFLWTLSENTEYFQAVKEKNQLEADRLNERLSAENVNYTVSGDAVSVEVDLKNEGSLSVHLTTLWVLDTTIRKYGFNNTLNINLKPGEILPIKGTEAIKVVIEDADNAHIFSSWFITARGNAVPLEKEKGIIVAQLAQGIGSLALDFYKFKYFEYESATKLKDYPSGNIGFTVPANTYIAFGCSLTNLDPEKRTIVFDSHSLLWVIVPTSDVPHSTWWYIVNVAQDGRINATYSPISLAYGETKMIIFASASDLGSSSFSRQTTPKAGLSAPVFLLLHGQIGSIAYGQNLPFVALYFT
jgi:archaellum component FlaF (FlaF/FlaG flagellin family)